MKDLPAHRGHRALKALRDPRDPTDGEDWKDREAFKGREDDDKLASDPGNEELKKTGSKII